MKVVINKCYGGFGISKAGLKRYEEITGESKEYWDIDRDDPALVQLVEELGKAVNDSYSDLAIVEIPDDVEWEVEEYDGAEWVAEKHRTWS